MEAEELDIELEALCFTYAEALTVLHEDPLTVKLAAAPYTGTQWSGLSINRLDNAI